MIVKRVFGALLVGALLASWATADPRTEAIDAIIAEGTRNNQAPRFLRELCLGIGGRVSGSPELDRAKQWALGHFRGFGLENVRLEQWGETPVGWNRGSNMYGKMIAPYAMDLVVTAPAFSAPTPGPVRAEVVMQPATMAELERVGDSLKGKWVLMSRRTGGGDARPPRVTPDAPVPESIQVEMALDRYGIAGRVFGSANRNDWLQNNGSWAGLDPNNLPTDVRLQVAGSNYRKIRRQLIAGERVELEFNLDHGFLPGARPQYNVIAEIRGTEKPDEFVIVGGHIDSWAPPGGQGANDNGVGVAVALEAARLIAQSGVKPKRTIRFIIWSGEEQGLLGARGDVERLREAGLLDKVSVVLNEDSGSNWNNAIPVLASQKEMMDRAHAATNRLFADTPIEVRVVERVRAGGSDHAAYFSAGVPAFTWFRSGPLEYGKIWHTPYDTLDNVIMPNVERMALNMALVSFSLANEDQLLPRQ